MLATQYKIILPSDYDMNIIKERVRKNGPKTDGFPGLKFKLYLITEKGATRTYKIAIRRFICGRTATG